MFADFLPPSVTQLRDSTCIARRASQLLRAQSYQEAAIQAKDVLLNWFVPFLEVWSGIVAGSLRLDRGRLIIATRHERHSAIASACK